ncbi:sulfite exporter TauE/SafE family protein [Lutibaculum baratangense]|uniref:Probable membrane transporter protein n=1 Tax=Lutibaculum baratangense AMV1 TaxID=631454 RepID=V4RK51_9HYPH|nr:sulfite exporter TauE/SafE family protein [Lutibaculum baratangense]ESR26416.1 Sulfite exporter TauE/SafE [Lutibaculum baratangense AMV1]
MQIYLPVAELAVNMFMILGMGAAVGFLSGMFGVGGGFLLTPLLIFSGIPPAVAVATQANQTVATSVSGALAHWRRRSLDVRLGLVLVAGGAVGSFIGAWLFRLLQALGQLDLAVSLLYVIFLGLIGGLMMLESARAMWLRRRGRPVPARRPGQHRWIHGLPLKVRFKQSRLYISAIPVVLLGVFIGLLVAIMGVGGGFIMVPALIYLLRVPTNVVIGTSLFQIVFVTALTTVLHATVTGTVDVVLALLLMAGGVIGAQFGAYAGQKLRGEQLRALLGLLVLSVCVRLMIDLVVTPDDLYNVSGVVGG